MLVRSFNIANDFTERQSNSIKVVVPNPFNSTLIAILVGSCILMVVLLVALTVFFLHAWCVARVRPPAQLPLALDAPGRTFSPPALSSPLHRLVNACGDF